MSGQYVSEIKPYLEEIILIPYSGYFPGGKIFVDVQIFFHSWFNVRGTLPQLIMLRN